MPETSCKVIARQAVLFLIAGLMVLCTLAMPVARLISEAVEGLFLNGKVAALATCCGLLLYRNYRIDPSWRMRKTLLLYALLFFALCLDVLLLLSKYGIDSSAVNFIKFKLLPLTGIFIGYSLKFKKIQLAWLLKFFLVVGAASALIGIIQWIGGPHFFDSLGLSSEIGSEYHFDTAVDSNGRPVFRTFSIFRDHYEFAAVLSISTLCTLVLLWNKSLSFRAAFIVIMLLFVGLLTTYNMTAWLSLILTVTATFLIKIWLRGIRLSPQRIVVGIFNLALITGVASFAFVKLGMIDRVVKNTQMGDSSLYYRGLIFLQQIEMIIQNPMGWGLQAQDFPKFFTADNYLPYLTVLAGVPWSIVYLIIFAVPMIVGYKTLKILFTIRSDQFPLALGIYGLLIYTTVGLFSNSPILTTSFNFIFWMSIGHLLSLAGRYQNTVAGNQ